MNTVTIDRLRFAYTQASIVRMNATADALAAAEAAEAAASDTLIAAVDKAGLAGSNYDPRSQGSFRTAASR